MPFRFSYTPRWGFINQSPEYAEFSDGVDELMEIASMIITKPGGMTTSEALAKGLPMVIINPIPGQEMNNASRCG